MQLDAKIRQRERDFWAAPSPSFHQHRAAENTTLIRRARTVTNIKFGASPHQFIKDWELNLITEHVVIGSGRLTTGGILRTIARPINLWASGNMAMTKCVLHSDPILKHSEVEMRSLPRVKSIGHCRGSFATRHRLEP
jgi:hypothetical protein